MGAMRANANTFDIVCDCHGFRISDNLDPRPTVAFMKMLQQPFRDRLRHGFVVDAPKAFGWLWRIASSHMPKATRDKIKFCSQGEVVQQLSSSVSPKVSRVVHDVMAGNRADSSAVPPCLPSELVD